MLGPSPRGSEAADALADGLARAIILVPRQSRMSSASRLVTDLRQLGIIPGGVLLVHASLKSLGVIPGGLPELRTSLETVLGPHGTLLLPTLTYQLAWQDSPCFDPVRTPSQVGAFSEWFRQQPGVQRSWHPTHSVAGIGPAFTELVAGHIDDATPCGPRSPFHRLLVRDDAQVLFLGCGLHPNTCMHAVEELVSPPYHAGDPVRFRIVTTGGTRIERTIRGYAFRTSGVVQRYDRLGDVLVGEERRRGRVLGADCDLLAASAIRRRGLTRLLQDHWAFVDRPPASPPAEG